jgi:hypothetical protein
MLRLLLPSAAKAAQLPNTACWSFRTSYEQALLL